MRLGIFAKTFPGTDPATVLAAARDAGYSCVQWNWACAGLEAMPQSIPASAVAATRRAIDSTGIDIVAVSGTFNMIHPDPRVREAGLARLDAIARNAREIGTSLVTLCTGSRNPDDQWQAHPDNLLESAWVDLVESLGRAINIADRYDVRLGIEPELANVIDGVERAVRLFEPAAQDVAQELDATRLSIVIDAANLAERGDAAARKSQIESAISALSPYIEIAHAKDRCVDGSFATVGEGAIDFAHYLECLQQAGFDGPIITHGLSAFEAPRVARALLKALDPGR